EEYAERNRLGTAAPQLAIGIAHGDREEKPGGSRHYDEDAEAPRRLVEQAAEVLRYRVHAPAGRMQRPENDVPVRPQLVERKHAAESLGHLSPECRAPWPHRHLVPSHE